MCGAFVIDVALLKRRTRYDDSMPGGEKHPVAALFWEVMEGLPNEDRVQVMAFAWGRRRMPQQVCRPRAAHPPPPCRRHRISGCLSPPSLPPSLSPSIPPHRPFNAGGPAAGTLPSRAALSAAPSRPIEASSAVRTVHAPLPPAHLRTQHSQ